MIRLFKHYISYRVLVLGLVDAVLLGLCAELAWRIRLAQMGASVHDFPGRIVDIVSFALIVWCAAVAVGCYRPEMIRSIRLAAARLIVAIGLGVAVIAIFNFFFPGTALWRSILLLATIMSIVALIVSRILTNQLIGGEALMRRVLVMGAGERAGRLLALSKKPGSSFVILTFLSMTDAPPMVPGAQRRAAVGDLGRLVEEQGITEVVLAIEERRNSLPLKDLLRVKTKGVFVYDFGSFLERETGRVDLDTLNPSWLIFSDGFSAARALSALGKRGFDIVVSLAALATTLPLIALFALLVRAESKGPAFFRQTRVGLYGEPFTIYKLRSMRQDAEAGGVQWAQEDDPRITRIGRIIRKVRIDELPQLWSVLKGDMSFVGPRPEVPHFVAELEEALPFYAERHEVKPGITGWAQINFPYGASVEDSRHKLEYDLYYAKNYTLFLDLVILLQTARVILWPEGAR